MSRGRAHTLITVHGRDDVPQFANEDEEWEFWRTHELGDDVWDQAESLSNEERLLFEQIQARHSTQRAGHARG
jgi:hypothetical protein